MSDDDATDENAPAADETATHTEIDEAGEGARSDRAVHLSGGMLAALILVLALAIGGAGYAIGHSSGGNDSNDGRVFNPISDVRDRSGADGSGGQQRDGHCDHRGPDGDNSENGGGNGNGNGSGDNSESNRGST